MRREHENKAIRSKKKLKPRIFWGTREQILSKTDFSGGWAFLASGSETGTVVSECAADVLRQKNALGFPVPGRFIFRAAKSGTRKSAFSGWRNPAPGKGHFRGGEFRHPGKCISRVANSGIQETWPSNIFSDPSKMIVAQRFLQQRPPIPFLVAKLETHRL